ncbi:cytochrome c oxidase subunit II [Saliphagus sp. LR7]|uniref:cytochrome c oxidase subunit II n=1 Tax=Saliphagus sp. LR7 TaxID=2282654 RepID=UPI000DF82C9F|nr:cytochrome c oxidase subunit II [Saliphagus sp. LR7]
MTRVRRGVVAVVVLLSVVLAATPSTVAASSVTDQLIRRLNRQLLYMAVPIAVLVEIILIYTLWRFRGNDEPRPTRENRQLEITWTVATALVLLFVGTASFHALAHPSVSTIDGESGDVPDDAVEVDVTAEQWEYAFEYPDAGVATNETLVLPENRSIYLSITAEDVVHSVHVPELGLKQDAIPGETNLLRTELTGTGEYRLYCAELCGVGHSGMLSTVEVVSEDEYEAWLEDQRAGEAGNESATDATNESSGGDEP